MSLVSCRLFPRAAFWGLSVAVLVAGLSGCGGQKNAKLTGKVSYKGSPLPGGILTLNPPDEKTQSSIPIVIKPDGTFVTMSVLLGNYKVGITSMGTNPALDPSRKRAPAGVKMREGGPPSSNLPEGAKHVDLPQKYARPDTSGLSWDVKGGSQEKNFPLE